MAPKKQSRKRPAASISSVEPPPAAPPAAPPAWVEEQLADASQVELVEWAMHMTMLLVDDLKATAAKMGRNGTINLWCDFAGTASEAFAARHIEEVLTANGIFQDIQFRVYLACDNDTSCREFIKVNHQPRFTANDAMARDFGTGILKTETGDITMPRGGIDIYVACFPCGPFSSRGKRLGLCDKNGMYYARAIDTIAHMKPATYVMENVCTLTHKKAGEETSNFDVITEASKNRLPDFDICTVTKIDPTHTGHCQRKPRLLQLGVRGDIAPQGLLAQKCDRLLKNPLPIAKNYRQFLNLKNTHNAWHRFNCFPEYEESIALKSTG